MAAVDMVSGLHAYFQIISRTKARCRCQLLHGHGCAAALLAGLGRMTLRAASQSPATLDIVINSTPAAAAPALVMLSSEFLNFNSSMFCLVLPFGSMVQNWFIYSAHDVIWK